MTASNQLDIPDFMAKLDAMCPAPAEAKPVIPTTPSKAFGELKLWNVSLTFRGYQGVELVRGPRVVAFEVVADTEEEAEAKWRARAATVGFTDEIFAAPAVVPTKVQNEVIGDLLYTGYEYSEGLYLDLYGSYEPEYGHIVDTASVMGTKVSLADMLPRDKLVSMSVWLDSHV